MGFDFSETQKKFLDSFLKKHNEAVCSELKGEINELKQNTELLRVKIGELEAENKELKNRLNDIDSRSRKKNLLLFGLNSQEAELEEKVREVIESKLRILKTENFINDVYRLGRNDDSPVLLEISNQKFKQDILKQVSKLKGSGIVVS